MANGLLDLLGGLGTTPPAYLEGLLGAQPVEDLRKRSIGTGIANALIGYLATPKNQNLGLGRILANTAQAGMQGAQGVYDSATADYMQAQKIEEINRKKAQREAYDAAFGGLYKTTPAQYENVSTSGGYAPQQSEIASGQISPNYGMTKLPDVVTQREIAPARSEISQDAIMQMVASGDPRANEMLTGLKLMSEFNKKEKVDSPFAKVDVANFTPESVALFAKTNDISVLRKAPEKEKSMTEEPIRVAKALFNKPLNELNSLEMQQLNDYIEQSKVRVVGAGVPSQQPTFKDASTLRGEFKSNPVVKAFDTQDSAYKIIKSTMTNPSPAGDLAGITKFMKLLDPESVVRESEIGLARNANGLYDKLATYAQNRLSGKILTPPQRADFLATAEQFYNIAREQKKLVENEYSDIARVGGLDPKLVVGSPTSETSLSAQDMARKLLEQRKKR